MKCRRVEILAAVVLFVCTSPVLATIHFKDGGVHNIYYYFYDFVLIDYESPGLKTTLNILDGATIPYPYRLIGCEDSIINILGGSVYRLESSDSSQVTVSGGSINRDLSASDSSQVTVSDGSVDWLWAYDISQLTVSGGSINRYLSAYGSSQVAVSGGSITSVGAHDSSEVTVSGGSINNDLFAYDSSQVTVSGGSIGSGWWGGGLRAYDSSQVAVSGGSMGFLYARGSGQVAVSGGSMDVLVAYGSSQVTVSGGSIGYDLRLHDGAILTIDGSDFAVDGTFVGYTELYSIFGGDYLDEPYRQLTGTLLSGDPINNHFRIGNSAKIVLVPEPATLLLLGLGGLALLRKRN